MITFITGEERGSWLGCGTQNQGHRLQVWTLSKSLQEALMGEQIAKGRDQDGIIVTSSVTGTQHRGLGS